MVSFRQKYDNDLNGTSETVRLLPASTAALAAQQIAPGLHQPFPDGFAPAPTTAWL